MSLDNPKPVSKPREKSADDANTVSIHRPHWADSIIAVFTVLIFLTYVTSNYFLWQQRNAMLESNKISRAVFSAANRPYVGINGENVFHIQRDANGKTVAVNSERPTGKENALAFRVEIKNFGPVPGLSFHHKVRFTVGGIEASVEKVPDIPTTIFPGQLVYVSGNVWNAADYNAIMAGNKVMEYEITIWYEGPGASYMDCEKHQYKPKFNAFISLGMSCPSQ